MKNHYTAFGHEISTLDLKKKEPTFIKALFYFIVLGYFILMGINIVIGITVMN